MSGEYRVPSMTEIRNIPWNGCNVVSTFSGGGGSSLGYEMAGYHVLWANEFVEEAANTYRLNHKSTVLNTKDIRTITGRDIVKESGILGGEIDLFDGSPPCCAFSMAGKREASWGKQRDYSGTVQRVDDLFFEYIRLLNELKPRVFVAENVKGLVIGSAKGYFKEILNEMKKCGYNVSARLLNAAYLGVPQNRERIIFVGVRKDLCEKYGVRPVHPVPFKKTVSLKEALDNVENDKDEERYLLECGEKYAWGKVARKIEKNPKNRISGSSVMNGSYFNLVRDSMYYPASTVCQRYGNESVAGSVHPLFDRKYTIAELKRITSIPDDFVLTGSFPQKWERLGRMVPPLMMKEIATTIYSEILCKIKS